MQMTTGGFVLKVITVLWVIWGLVHMLAGAIVLSGDATQGVQAIADAVPPEELIHGYHAAVGGILNQHGWNLGWFGLATVIGGVMIWRGNATALWVTALIGGMADVGYLFFVDVPGFVNFMPGTVMTLVSGSAILLSVWVWRANRSAA